MQVDAGHISRIERGMAAPSLELAVRISRYTQGEVKPEDLLPIAPGEESTAG